MRPEVEKEATPGGTQYLLDVVERLRGEDGCPWDREQTLETLKEYLVEETYELLDAIDSGDPVHHAEELGDVLLQIALQAQIQKENGEFTFEDVAQGLAEKLIRRHPHVFADTSVSGTRQVLRNWEAIKAEEKGGRRRSLLEGLPEHLPALQKAQRVQVRAARVGFDWDRIEQVLEKVDEELRETREALRSGDTSRTQEEIGDLLFAAVNLSRFASVNAEEALRQTVKKFAARFRKVEQRLETRGMSLVDSSLEEMDREWNAVKEEEGS